MVNHLPLESKIESWKLIKRASWIGGLSLGFVTDLFVSFYSQEHVTPSYTQQSLDSAFLMGALGAVVGYTIAAALEKRYKIKSE